MKRILVTGAHGFIGGNLCLALRRQSDFEVLEFDVGTAPADFARLAARAELVFHLAGVNRPSEEQEFAEGNCELTRELCKLLVATTRPVPLVLSSSIQAELDNCYGRSKHAAEEIVLQYHHQSRAPVYIYRFPNVFGKWSRPNYNSVVATFCYNISRGLPVQVNNRANPLRFAHIDDIIRELLRIAVRAEHDREKTHYELHPVFETTLGELYDLIVSFGSTHCNSLLPNLSNPFVKYLHSTYASFCDARDLAHPVELNSDERGWLFELVKSPCAGQIFVSRTRPGITRGNHYHDTKVEKFCVIHGQGIIRLRPVLGTEILEYPVSDREIKIVDIPPGYTHSIRNTGSDDLLTLFWASEIFDPQRPDTYSLKVQDHTDL